MKVIDLQTTCGGCPMIFEWKNKKEKSFYFRLRHGYARISNDTTEEVLIEGPFPYGDGVCSFEDVQKWSKKLGLKLKLI